MGRGQFETISAAPVGGGAAWTAPMSGDERESAFTAPPPLAALLVGGGEGEGGALQQILRLIVKLG